MAVADLCSGFSKFEMEESEGGATIEPVTVGADAGAAPFFKKGNLIARRVGSG